jgi:aspartyl protease family protein
MYKSGLALALVFAGTPSFVAAQALTKCTVGQPVTDQEGKTGVIVSDNSNLCQVKYGDGQTYGWIFWNLRPAAERAKSGSTALDPGQPNPVTRPPAVSGVPTNNSQALTILRPPTAHVLVFRADPRGHVTLTAIINGAPVRLLVDTGASLVFLTLEDARVAGISRGELLFSQRVDTANGPVRVAPVMLREIRMEHLSIEGVPAAVIENLDRSVLGMSFLKRLKSFEMREGALTINW